MSYTYEEEEDRLNRFLSPTGTGAPDSLGARATSQPPRTTSAYQRSPSTQHFIPSSLSSRSAIPISGGRSSSFSAQNHGFTPRSISSSTFEEDEEDLFPEYSSSFDNRGRPMANDVYSRSRSQSLAPVSRPIASPPTISRFGSAYDTFLHTRFNSGASPHGRETNNNIDLSNMSPFFRDILHDDSPYLDNGGGSGATSRRHSVSIVQPRTRNVGFNAPSQRSPEHSPATAFGSFRGGGGFGGGAGGGLGLSDEDLAGSGDFDFGFNNLSIGGHNNGNGHHVRDSSSGSLPVGSSPFQPRKLHIPQGSPKERMQPPELTARFIPGQGIQYLPQDNGYGASRYHHHPAQSPLSPSYNGPPPTQQDVGLGKGVPLHSVPSSWPLYIVEFKAGRTDLFYFPNAESPHGPGAIRIGDLVLVEADRGKDVGTVVNDSITVEEIERWQAQQQQLLHQAHDGEGTAPPTPTTNKEINPKRMFGKANKQDVNMLAMKGQDELKALQLCQSKVRARKLPMEVVDAEYQWDRKKLTFYFVAEKRIDFRELVRELFRLYKTRIWMASLNGPPGSAGAGAAGQGGEA